LRLAAVRAFRPALSALLAGLCLACRPGPEAGAAASSDPTNACPGLAGETVRWIVPFTPGGGFDVYSRLLEPVYERAIGAEIVIENRTGAGGQVGARLVHGANPDGRTLGLMNGSALLVQGMLREDSDLHPTRAFTAIGRIAVAVPVVFSAYDSPYESLEELQAGLGGRRMIFGIVGVGSTSWISYVVATELLGLNSTFVVGYPGTRESSLGLIRGEFDLAGYTFESMLDRTGPGGLRPLIQLADDGVGESPASRGTPVLGGEDGLAARHALELGRDPAAVVAQAAALDRIFLPGRLVVGPPGMDPALTECLRSGLAEAARDPAFLADASRAGRSVAFLDAAAVASELEATTAEREVLGEVFRRYADGARAGGGGH